MIEAAKSILASWSREAKRRADIARLTALRQDAAWRYGKAKMRGDKRGEGEAWLVFSAATTALLKLEASL